MGIAGWFSFSTGAFAVMYSVCHMIFVKRKSALDYVASGFLFFGGLILAGVMAVIYIFLIK